MGHTGVARAACNNRVVNSKHSSPQDGLIGARCASPQKAETCFARAPAHSDALRHRTSSTNHSQHTHAAVVHAISHCITQTA